MQLKKDDENINNAGSPGGTMYGGPVNNNYGEPVNNNYGSPMNNNFGGQGYYSNQGNNYGQPQGYNMGYAEPPKSSFGYTKLFIILILILIAGVVIYAGVTRLKQQEYTPGTTSGQVYRNEYFGFKISLDSGYMVIPNTYDAEAEKKALEKEEIVVELQSVNLSNSHQIVAFIVQRDPYYITQTDKDLGKALDEHKDEFKAEAESSGFKINSMERDSISVGGKVYEGYRMTASDDGITTVGYVQYYALEGKYLGAFTAFGNNEADAKQILLNSLSPLDN